MHRLVFLQEEALRRCHIQSIEGVWVGISNQASKGIGLLGKGGKGVYYGMH